MFEVYLSDRRDLLVIKKGRPMPPIGVPGKWRKRKKKVIRVSDEIESAVQAQGYYVRKLRELD
jgi:hypothetical protein